jgi:outer membrane protein OmpA-like peptidoglycan-associated protein
MTCNTTRRGRLGRISSRILLTATLLGTTAGLASTDALSDSGASVTDFSGAKAEVIEVEDITSALAVPRGTRIEPSAPPTVRLPIFFEFNSTQLRPEASALLDKVGAALASDELGTFRFSVEGHTDAVGTDDANMALSQQRAVVVKEYLIAQGVPEERLATTGHGEAEPVGSNDDDEGRQRNRRVELINLGSAE